MRFSAKTEKCTLLLTKSCGQMRKNNLEKLEYLFLYSEAQLLTHSRRHSFGSVDLNHLSSITFTTFSSVSSNFSKTLPTKLL